MPASPKGTPLNKLLGMKPKKPEPKLGDYTQAKRAAGKR